MSGTEGLRPDGAEMGLVEQSAVRPMITAPDGLDYYIEKERAVLKKFDRKDDGTEWTTEQMDSGEAVAAGALAEVLVLENGEIVERWVRGESEHGPPNV
ncbi:MAG TPA: hypothetical protein VFI41_05395 [Gemmatimonadales bacterium]|nr:hypothetical protein [Gemmatimonadales bacterium]